MKNIDSQIHNLANTLKTRRNQLHLTQEKLADIAGFDRTYISLIERGQRNPSYLNLIKLCNALELNIIFVKKGKNNDVE